MLRAWRLMLHSDLSRLKDEHNTVLALPVDDQEAHTDEFDGFQQEWIKRLWKYIDSARTMYSEGLISIDHFKAVAKCVIKFTKRCPKPFDEEDIHFLAPPCVDDI